MPWIGAVVLALVTTACPHLGDQASKKAPSLPTPQPPEKRPAQRQDGDFRWSHWGENRTAVKASEEGASIEEGTEAISLKAEIAGLNSDVVYSFVDDRLVGGAYLINSPHMNANLYIDEFRTLKGLLTDKYGKPSVDRTAWSDDLYRNDPQHWGTAVSAGHVAFIAGWKQPETEIQLILRGDNFKVQLGAIYKSIKLAKLVESTSKKKALKGL